MAEETSSYGEGVRELIATLEARLDGLLKRADVNGDGFIDLEEFRAVLADHFKYRKGKEELSEKDLSRLEKQAVRTLARFDTDRDKLLDKAEFRAFLKQQIADDESGAELSWKDYWNTFNTIMFGGGGSDGQ